MNADQKKGAGAYKADSADLAVVDTVVVEEIVVVEREDRGRAPFRLNLTKNRELEFDYRRTAIAAGALALGYAAFRGVRALIERASEKSAIAAGHTTRLEPVPLAESATPIKDNAAPRFDADDRVDGARPFVASSTQDDTGDLVEGMTETEVVAAVTAADRSAETAEHVPTDLMADRDPGSGERAIDAFRPDPTAPVPEGMRDSLRPATGTPPGFAAARGTFASGLSQTDGSK